MHAEELSKIRRFFMHAGTNFFISFLLSFFFFFFALFINILSSQMMTMEEKLEKNDTHVNFGDLELKL